jgi:hypothetical protein
MGMMSLKAEDCIADYSGLDEKQVHGLGPKWSPPQSTLLPRIIIKL